MSLNDRIIEKLTVENRMLKRELVMYKIRLAAMERGQKIIDRLESYITEILIDANFTKEQIQSVVESIPDNYSGDPERDYVFRRETQIILYKLLIGEDPLLEFVQEKDQHGNWVGPNLYQQCVMDSIQWIGENCPWWEIEELEYKDGKRRFILKPTDNDVPFISIENAELDD